MNFREGEAKKFDQEENKAWIDMLDSLVDFISASKTMIKIINEKFGGNGMTKSVISSPDLPNALSLPDETIKEIHVNSAFVKAVPATNYANVIQEDSNDRFLKRFPRHHSASQFLDEQYNLTKQTIARRFRPQSRLATLPNTKNSPRNDYVMNDTYTEGVYRISSPKARSFYQERYAQVRNMDYKYSAKNRNFVYDSMLK